MGIFDFSRDAGDTRGAEGARTEDLRQGNTIIRKMKAAGLPVDDVRVEYDGGTVVLRGSVPSTDIRETMVVMAGNTPGVARVEDELRGPKDDGLGGRLHTVRKGESLSAIAQERLRDADRWKEIFEANRSLLDDPDEIYPGQVLRLPPATAPATSR